MLGWLRVEGEENSLRGGREDGGWLICGDQSCKVLDGQDLLAARAIVVNFTLGMPNSIGKGSSRT